MEAFDYVIVGAGTAGCVLAARLTEDSDTTVCLLEAGGRDNKPMIHIPAGFMKLLSDPDVNWLYHSEPIAGTDGRRILMPRGKTLGGSSSINGHIYNRGQRHDYDTWAQLGNRGWSYAQVLPYFKRSEHRTDGDDTFRGRHGPMTVNDLYWSHPLCEAFMDGAERHGIPRNSDYNGADQLGVSYSQVLINKGRRVSAARGFLHPALKRPNLDVRIKAHASEVLFDGKRAKGVRYSRAGRSTDVAARREVILSGGAVNSPQLLQLSGVGSPDWLRSVGIEVRHSLPGVGENLRDHFAPRYTARVKNVSSINSLARGLRLVGEIAKYFAGRQSILSLSPSNVYLFCKSDTSLDHGDLQMVFSPASYKEGVYGQLDELPGMTIGVWQQRPESTGFVRIQSADPFAAPAIQPNYLADQFDQQVLLRGMRLAHDLFHADPLMPYFEADLLPGHKPASDDEWLHFARHYASTA
ncbi:MAG: GMC family oxidoreductase N-terminal domain-containing protein, partial [Gammaproteobacteria bacterium]|nr:GMC family oxidoreductase N-terminal domain-containing protein [Gammaproteobacteria bacterium]